MPHLSVHRIVHPFPLTADATDGSPPPTRGSSPSRWSAWQSPAALLRRAGALIAILLASTWAQTGAQDKPPIGPPPSGGGGGPAPACAGCPTNAITITAVTQPMTVAPSASGVTAVFNVANGYSYDVDVNLSCNTPTAPVTSCSNVTPSYVNLAAGAQTTVSATFSVSGTMGTGYLQILGYHDALTGPNPALGSQQVIVTAPFAPTLTLRNRPDQLERGLCLTAGAGEAAWQCGDLLVAHSMPGYRTLGRDRALTLVYNSATAAPRPTVAVAVTQPAGSASPVTVFAELRVGAHGAAQAPVASATYNGWGGAGTPWTRNIVLGFDAAGYATGIYDYTLEIRNQFVDSVKSATLTGQLIVVNRAASRYGRGWELAGVEWIQYYAGGASWPNGKMLWVGGDGSARIYTPVGGDTTAWRAPAGGFRDRLDLVGGVYTRRLRHGVQVQYNGYGRHIKTVNRAGQETVFGWDATYVDVLRTITIPPAGSGLTYQVNYTGYYVGTLVDPGSRPLTLTVSGGQLIGIQDPDNVSLAFGYDAAGRMTSRTNRKGYAARYEYANGLRVTKVHVPYGATGADTARTTYEPWDERGLVMGISGSGFAAVDTALVRTRIDGSRTTVADTASFYVDKWGAPVKTVNALGETTLIARGDSLVPALVTRVRYHTGRVVRMSYNTRGNLTLVRDSTDGLLYETLPVGTPNKKTVYQYLDTNAPDSPSSVTDSLGRTSTYVYDTLGLVTLATDTRGHKTWFTHQPSGAHKGLLIQVTEDSVTTWRQSTESTIKRLLTTTVTYDAKGNPSRVVSPVGVATSIVNDAMGRPTDTYDALSIRRSTWYSSVNRVDSSGVHRVPYGNLPGGDPLAACDATQITCSGMLQPTDSTWPAVITNRMFNGPMALDSVLDPRAVIRSFKLDARGSLWKEFDEFGGATIHTTGAAGELLSVQTRTGHTATMTYDALGRRTHLVFPSRDWGGGLVVPADDMATSYISAGLKEIWTNRNGTLERYFNSDGSLRRTRWLPGSGVWVDETEYRYDVTGARTVMRRNQDSVLYAYRTNGDLDSVRVRRNETGGSRSFVFLWDELGRRQGVLYRLNSGGTMTVNYAYDAAGTLRHLTSSHPNAVQTNWLTFTAKNVSVDPLGRILRQDIVCPGGQPGQEGLACGGSLGFSSITESRYNALGWMTYQANDFPITFGYDLSGNQVSRVMSGGTYAMTNATAPGGRASNRLQLRTFPNAANPQLLVLYGSDAAGARSSESIHQPNLPIDHYDYWYDALGRATGHRLTFGGETIPPAVADACRYDPLGRQANVCGLAWLAYDGANVAGTLMSGTTNQNETWRFVHGPGLDDPLYGVLKKTNGTYREYLYVTDGNGRQFVVAPENGQMGSFYPDITDWGGSLAGATGKSFTFDANRHTMSAGGTVSSFRNRLYDQATGRWAQEDPIGVAGGINMYQFNGNNPATFTDPFGLCPECKARREKVEGKVYDTDPGLLDPTALLGGVAGLTRSLAGKVLAKQAAAAGERVLFEGGKDALKQALATGIEGVNAGQASAIGQALKQGSADVVKVTAGENGLVTYTTRAGRDGYQTLVRIYDQSGGLQGMAQAAWDAAGKLVHGEVWK